ncbi:GntR family transcriptional regulator [Teichococcus aerofrigidensis]
MPDTVSARAEAAPTPRLLARTLEEDIVLGRLHPRERLVEEELIQRFGATRHVIRLALTELERIGLVERIPHRGALVRSYAPQDVRQLYDLRELLECEAARLIPRPLPAADLAAIETLQREHDRAAGAADLAALFRANQAFHRRINDCCGNAFLATAIEAAAQRAHGIRFLASISPEAREAARREHHAMIAALRAGDGETLIALTRAHLQPSQVAYLRAYGGGP